MELKPGGTRSKTAKKCVASIRKRNHLRSMQMISTGHNNSLSARFLLNAFAAFSMIIDNNPHRPFGAPIILRTSFKCRTRVLPLDRSAPNLSSGGLDKRREFACVLFPFASIWQRFHPTITQRKRPCDVIRSIIPCRFDVLFIFLLTDFLGQIFVCIFSVKHATWLK